MSAPDAKTVVVDMVQGGGDLPAIVSSAPFAIVPPSVGDGEISPAPGSMVGQRRVHAGLGRRPTVDASGEPALLGRQAGDRHREHDHSRSTASPRWTRSSAGDGGHRPRSASPTPAGSRTTASSGRRSASDPSLSVTYYGFETRKGTVRRRPRPPGLRDGRRLAAARGARRPGSQPPATGMVPAGMPGAPAGRLPARVRRGQGQAAARRCRLPRRARASRPISFIGGGGGGYDERDRRDAQGQPGRHHRLRRPWTSAPTRSGSRPIRRTSGACRGWPTIRVPTTSSASCSGPAPPPTRVAGRTATFDAAIAQAIVGERPGGRDRRATPRRDADRRGPGAGGARVVRASFSLVRDGLLGAAQNGTGILRLAGLAWRRAVSARRSGAARPGCSLRARWPRVALLPPGRRRPGRDVAFGDPQARRPRSTRASTSRSR